MSGSKHTPGPWRIKPQVDGNFLIVYNDRGNWLAEVYDDDDPVEGRPEADARLIASAPDMLEALRDIVKQWPDSSAAKTARSVIAKAEGK